MSPVACSVVIPTRDRPGPLDACLEALASQSLPRDQFEVIVVDDGSRAPVEPRLLAWRSRLNIEHARTPGAGPSAARNAGIAMAAGRYIAFTDDDCVPDLGWLAALMTGFPRRPGALVGGRTFNLLAGSPAPEASQLISDVVQDFYNADPGHPRFFTSNNLAVEAGALQAVGGFDESLRTAEDRDLCDRWLASGRPIAFAPDAVVGHAHRMDLAGFVRQHMSYGRGACQFSRARRARRPGTPTVELAFYTGLLPRVARLIRGRRNPAAVGALLVVWQLANTAGFLQEWAAGHAPRRQGIS
ncbi:MAG: glycosyltransferase [Vicinamibacterales bacterium]